jgi:hypothetical protein
LLANLLADIGQASDLARAFNDIVNGAEDVDSQPPIDLGRAMETAHTERGAQ